VEPVECQSVQIAHADDLRWQRVRRGRWDRLERHHKHTFRPSRPSWRLLAD